MSNDEQRFGMSGSDEPQWDAQQITEDGSVVWTQWPKPKPDKFYPDGSAILDDDLLPATLKWAALFEDTKSRFVGNTTTIYGERLSTIWLGLDHSFGQGPPLIYETMLFAPSDREQDREYMTSYWKGGMSPEKKAAYEQRRKYIAKHYPHDQLQLRYSTRREAEDSHEQLKLHCLIPPRWRAFLLGTLGGHSMWKRYEYEQDNDD
jgi:hypothetical protein